jgi:hypothetical protein
MAGGACPRHRLTGFEDGANFRKERICLDLKERSRQEEQENTAENAERKEKGARGG